MDGLDSYRAKRKLGRPTILHDYILVPAKEPKSVAAPNSLVRTVLKLTTNRKRAKCLPT
jgi:hypothetical protein